MTLRARRDAAAFRHPRVASALKAAVARASGKHFQVVHFSFQRDHVHLVVEASDRTALARGIQGVAIRLARTTNRVLGRRGAVWAERYHARALTSPRAMRNALVYVLFNHRKHGHHGHAFDPCSSIAWFDGLAPTPEELLVGLPARAGPAPVAPSRTWLGRVGWRRGGLVGVFEAPRSPS